MVRGLLYLLVNWFLAIPILPRFLSSLEGTRVLTEGHLDNLAIVFVYRIKLVSCLVF